MAAGRAARSLGPRRRHRQRPGPSLPPRAAAPRTGHARPGTGHGPAEGEFAAALRAGAAADLDAIYGLDFIRGWPTGPCRSTSSPTTSPRTPSTSTATPGSWPAPPRSPPPRPSSCSGPARRRTAWKSNPSCTGPGSAPARTAPTLGPVTKSYVDHLLAASVSGSYGVLVAAALPCFWLYAEVGATLHGQFLAARRPGGAPLRRLAADLRRRGLRRRHPAGHRVHGRGGRAGVGERAGGHGPGLPAVIAGYEVDFFDAPRLHA